MISISTSKSGSNWLDRLRSSRGFPTGDEPNLGRFLSSSSSSGSTTRSESTQFTRRINSLRTSGKGKNVAGDVSDVLCDLFNMGECSRTFSKKNCRKQSNPRFFSSANFIGVDQEYPLPTAGNNELCSSDDLKKDKSVASSGDNSLNDKNRKNQNVEEEEEEMIDTKEYTKSEVTIIDTSFEEWKSDKWVFRKKDDWKIKDKKKNKFGSKKRKLLVDNDDELGKNVGEVDEEMINKKKKIMHLNKTQNDKARELLKEAAGFVGKVSQRRFPCPRPPERLRIENSPVILLKSIPSSNNVVNGITRLGKSAKKGRPKKFNIT